ncbi:hypothetical protein SK128_005092 [Halocaridina rubra]|uniref:DNA polymerase eta n=1 Tax=Halocaridina rubra TaxID=373956 RepID=A0AAN8ZYJ8_HALRR
MTDRIVVLLDMDCFYVQVEERHYPHIKGKPAAVVQYNTWQGGGIIAVNYEARAFGVKRGMRGDEARSKCPEIQLVQVPVNRGKADLTRYRDAGKEVINVLCSFSDCVERASIDEAYINFTDVVQKTITKDPGIKITPEKLKSSWVVGHDHFEDENPSNDRKEEIRKTGVEEWLSSLHAQEDEDAFPLNSCHPHWDNFRLAVAASICEEMRAAVFQQTGFRCSAGISHNKVLGKLSCGLHKPNQQTILPQTEVITLWQSMPVSKVRNLGGKLGNSLTEELGCSTMSDLASLSLQQLLGTYDNKTAHWLFSLGKGFDSEPVTARQLPKSIGCGKNFQGKEALNTRDKVQKWMRSLAEELSERLNVDQTSNKRRAKTLTVSVRIDGDDRFTSMSRSSTLPSYSAEKLARVALSLIQHTNQAPSKDHVWSPSLKNISLSAGKFEDWTGTGSADIQELFKKVRQSAKHNEEGSFCVSPNKGVKSQKKHVQTDNERSSMTEFSERGFGVQKVDVYKPSTSHPKHSNSFFRNFILKHENNSNSSDIKSISSSVSDDNRDENVDRADSLSKRHHDSDNESKQNALDLLISCLSDEDSDQCEGNNCEEKSDNDSDDSAYDAATDVDSGDVDTKVIQSSPDIFAEQITVDSTSRSTLGSTTERALPGCSKAIQVGDFSRNCSSEKGSETSPISVKELFPDLDNVDESLLSFLPKELKLEVQEALKLHRTKTREKKLGIWKFINCNPVLHSERGNSSRKLASAVEEIEDDIDEVVASSGTYFPAEASLNHDEGQAVNTTKENSDSVNYTKKEQALEDMIDCEQCGIKISVFEVPEHEDYHVALSLQNDMKKVSNTLNRGLDKSSANSQKHTKGRKRGNGNSSGQNTPTKSTKLQKLDAFFKL